MLFYCLIKNLKIFRIMIALFFYVLSILSILCFNISFLLLNIFLIIRSTVNLTNKHLNILFLNLLLIILNVIITFLLLNFPKLLSLQLCGFVSGIFFMFGNIEIFKFNILMREEILKNKRIKCDEVISNDLDNQGTTVNKDYDITWEEWKD